MGSIFKIFLLVLYLVLLSWRMFFYAYSNFYRIPGGRAYQYNLVPLKTIYSLIASYSRYGFTVWAYNLFGNIVVFMPLGFLLAALQKKEEQFSDCTHLLILHHSVCRIYAAYHEGRGFRYR
ncbi:MAG TPA: hypothetical protein DHV55_03235 [Clostridiaceae bacterium]|nr:hypothetical protein [Clostridiaceae bacterium]